MKSRIDVELIHQYRIHLNLPKGVTRLVVPADAVSQVCETLRAAADKLEAADAERTGDVRGEDPERVPGEGGPPAPHVDEEPGGS